MFEAFINHRQAALQQLEADYFGQIMTTTSLNTSPAGPFRRLLAWLNPVVPPHEMTDGERKLKKALFVAVLAPTAVVVVFMAELSLYRLALAKSNDAVAAAFIQDHPAHANLVQNPGVTSPGERSSAETAVLLQLQSRQQQARMAVSKPVPLCWIAQCDKLK